MRAASFENRFVLGSLRRIEWCQEALKSEKDVYGTVPLAVT